jgi:predicted transcriptional regulator
MLAVSVADGQDGRLNEKDWQRPEYNTQRLLNFSRLFFFLFNNVDSSLQSFYISESDLEEFKRSMSDPAKQSELLSLTTNIVAAHVSNNSVAATELPMIIRDVYDTLSSVGSPREREPERPSPAVPIKKSVTPEYIVCLEDGKKLKMLKRHLKTAYDMSPEDYRERWGLPADYPMVAPNYARQRSKLAKQIGLGTRARRKG